MTIAGHGQEQAGVMLNRWGLAAHVYALVMALSLSYFMIGNPLQINDSLGNLFQVQHRPLLATVTEYFFAKEYLRPLLWAQIEMAYDFAHDVAGGRYFETFKAIHVAQVLVTGMLFVTLLRIRTAAAALASTLGVAMLFGGHTFAGTVVEGYPINTFLTIVVCCLVAAVLSFGPPARWRTVAAVALFVFAALTVESGLLLAVIVVTAWLAGARGVSRGGVVAIVVLCAGYVVLRAVVLDIGSPGLQARSAGYGFAVLGPAQLQAQFGDRPYVFYAYNTASMLMTVLFAEPRYGVWSFLHDWQNGQWLPRQLISVAATTASTLLIVWYAAGRIGAWRRGEVRHGDRLLSVFAAVLAANAVIGFPYAKDVVASPAGAFHAAATVVALQAIIERLMRADGRRLAQNVVAAALCVVSALWVVRLLSIHYAIREHALIVRNDWAEIHWRMDLSQLTPDQAALTSRLRHEAIRRRVPATAFAQPTGSRYLDTRW